MTTEVYITANLPGAPIKGFDEPDTMVIKLENGWQLTCSATFEGAESQIAGAMNSWGLDIRAEVMGALHEHLNPTSEAFLAAAE